MCLNNRTEPIMGREKRQKGKIIKFEPKVNDDTGVVVDALMFRMVRGDQ